MKNTLLLIFVLIFLSGCTQVVTAPISIAGSAVGATVEVAGSAVGAAVNLATSDDDEKEEEK
jgi:uncharacterized protein YceK